MSVNEMMITRGMAVSAISTEALRMDWCLGPAYASQRWDNDTSASDSQTRVQNGDRCCFAFGGL